LRARQGKLAAIKKGRDWMTTREIILEYVKKQENRQRALYEKFQKTRENKIFQPLKTQNQLGFIVGQILLGLSAVFFAVSGLVHSQTMPVNLTFQGLNNRPTLYVSGRIGQTILSKPPLALRGPELPPIIFADGRNMSGRVLGTSTEADASAIDTATSNLIKSYIDQEFNSLVNSGQLTGPRGPEGPAGAGSNAGLTQNSNGVASVVVGGIPLVTYEPPQPQNYFSGASVAGTSQLSASGFTTDTLKISSLAGSSQCLQTNTDGTVIGSGGSCAAGGGSGTVNSGTQGFVPYYASVGTAISPSAVLWTDNSHVGIGTTTPAQKLVVAGNEQLTGALFDGSNAAGTLGMVLQTTGTGTQWVATSTLGITGAGVSGGTNGKVAVFTSASALSTGDLLDNLTVSGVNATSATVSFNIQGSGVLNPFNVASSSGASLFTITANGQSGFGSTTPNATLVVEGTSSSPNLDVFRVASSSNAVLFDVAANGSTTISSLGTGTVYSNAGSFYIGPTADAGIGTNGQAAYYSAANTLASAADFLNNGTVAGVNATSSTVSFSVQGNSTLDPFDVSTTTSGSLLRVTTGGLVGIGTTSPSQLLTVGNNNQFTIAKDGTVNTVGTVTANSFFAGSTGYFSNSIWPGGSGFALTSSQASTQGADLNIYDVLGSRNPTGGTSQILQLGSAVTLSFNPTSGSGVMNALQISYGVNQTSSASGVSRGIYLNPTLTSVYDYRNLETQANQVATISTSSIMSIAYNVLLNPIKYSSASATQVTLNSASTLNIAGAPNGTTASTTIASSTGITVLSNALTNVTNGYGLYVNAPTGASSGNYAAIFNGGNVGIGTSSPAIGPLVLASGAYVTAGGTWTNASDRNLKENFATLSPASILDAIMQLPITEWNYKTEGPSVKHIGPVAQDFYSIFNVGNSPTSISTIDPSGIALLGIQGLEQKFGNLLQGLFGSSATGSSPQLLPAVFSGDSVGQGKIPAGQTSVHVTFSQAYAYQPIVTVTPIGLHNVFYGVDAVDSHGFIIEIASAQPDDMTFNWQSFASPSEVLTVAGSSPQPIVLSATAAAPVNPSNDNTPNSFAPRGPQTPDVSDSSTPPTILSDSNASSTAPNAAPDNSASSTPSVVLSGPSLPDAPSTP